MALTADAVVIGGGVVGASALFHLTTLGARRTILCERREPGAGASGQSGAFIQLHFCRNAPETALTLAALPYFRQWDELVGAGSCGFVPAGYLRLEGAEQASTLRERVATLRALGVDSAVLGPGEIAVIAPALHLAGIGIAAYEAESGYADPHGTIAGFLAAARARGGATLTGTTVTGLRVAGGAIRGVETSAGPIDAPIVVSAAGAWSAAFLRTVGLTLPITGALTQWLGFDVPGLPPALATVGDGVTGSYFRALSPGATRILIGLGGMGRQPLSDPDDESARTIPPSIVALAQQRLAARLRGGEAARYVGGAIGPVTLTPDDLPIIDRHPGVAGLYYFAGDCGTSFKTAPAIGRALAEWALDGAPRIADLSAFGLARFAGA